MPNIKIPDTQFLIAPVKQQDLIHSTSLSRQQNNIIKQPQKTQIIDPAIKRELDAQRLGRHPIRKNKNQNPKIYGRTKRVVPIDRRIIGPIRQWVHSLSRNEFVLNVLSLS